MPKKENVKPKIGIVGCGVIGASWAAYFLARGFDVSATDPAKGAESALRAHIQSFWPILEQIGLSKGASQDRLTFNEDLAKALSGCGFVQENGPERIDIKRNLIAQIDSAVEKDVIIASSSSGIMISDVQDAARHPERVLLGHPFNPPHLIPLVEVAGGKLASPEAIEKTLAFYTSIGKKPILLRREMKGHIANRLQAALFREAIYLIEQGVASVADIDAAIAHGPGLRWALLGPVVNMHLSGGAGGLTHALDHLGPALEIWWKDLGRVEEITPAIKKQMVEGLNEELESISPEKMIQQRDEILVSLLNMKSAADQLL